MRRPDTFIHQRDEDCSVSIDTLCCTVCHVDHSGQCDECGGRGFHRYDCPSFPPSALWSLRPSVFSTREA